MVCGSTMEKLSLKRCTMSRVFWPESRPLLLSYVAQVRVALAAFIGNEKRYVAVSTERSAAWDSLAFSMHCVADRWTYDFDVLERSETLLRTLWMKPRDNTTNTLLLCFLPLWMPIISLFWFLHPSNQYFWNPDPACNSASTRKIREATKVYSPGTTRSTNQNIDNYLAATKPNVDQHIAT